MDLDEFQRLAWRTSGKFTERDLRLHAIIGLAAEAGEAADLLKKVEFFGHDLDPAKLANELGDVLWYLADTASAYGLSLNDIAEGNVAKLRARYPEGFTSEASTVRADVAAKEVS